jgi:hypothetical protein
LVFNYNNPTGHYPFYKIHARSGRDYNHKILPIMPVSYTSAEMEEIRQIEAGNNQDCNFNYQLVDNQVIGGSIRG